MHTDGCDIWTVYEDFHERQTIQECYCVCYKVTSSYVLNGKMSEEDFRKNNDIANPWICVASSTDISYTIKSMFWLWFQMTWSNGIITGEINWRDCYHSFYQKSHIGQEEKGVVGPFDKRRTAIISWHFYRDSLNMTTWWRFLLVMKAKPCFFQSPFDEVQDDDPSNTQLLYQTGWRNQPVVYSW